MRQSLEDATSPHLLAWPAGTGKSPSLSVACAFVLLGPFGEQPPAPAAEDSSLHLCLPERLSASPDAEGEAVCIMMSDLSDSIDDLKKYFP